MQVGLLCAADTRRPAVRSGTPYYMARALERRGVAVAHLGPVAPWQLKAGRRLSILAKALTGRPFHYLHSTALARAYAGAFRPRLAVSDRPDVLLGALGVAELAFLETNIPVVYTADATFALLDGYYPGLTNVRQFERAQANEVERRALERAGILAYASAWAAASARADYGQPAGKIHVVPYGANLDQPPSREEALVPPAADSCDLAFVGVDWLRKGGPLAKAAVERLRAGGLDARLVVVGCVPPEPIPSWLRVVPRLDKRDPAQVAELSRVFRGAHFLFLPTRSECYGIVFCEASAHGRPSIATDTGGVSSAVADGENGFLLPPAAGPDDYADLIGALHGDRGRYEALVASSRRAYDTRLNWDAWAERLEALMATLA